MNALAPIQHAEAVPAVVEVRPIVLRFANLHPGDLGKFKMHDQRKGGDLSHVDTDRTADNRIEFGEATWIEDLRAEVVEASRQNLRNHLDALELKSRKAEAAHVREAGLVDPWRRCSGGPLREGILTVNKAWFGGTGIDAWEGDRVEAFRAHAMAFLLEYFPADQLRFASSHSDEEAFHLHFLVAVWTQRETANRGVQRLLQASVNPLLAGYEHAQDMAGAHFEQIGLCRGECRAAARRAALASDLPPEPKLRHVPPSAYRAEEKRKGGAEKARIIEAARSDAESVTEAARALSQSAVRKSRKRAVREAQARKATAAKEEAAAIQRRDAAAAEAVSADEAVRAARLQNEANEATAAVTVARAKKMVQAAMAAMERVQSLKTEVVDAEVRLEALQGQVEIEEQKKAAAEAKAAAAQQTQVAAAAAAVAAHNARLEEEGRAALAKAQAADLTRVSSSAANRIDALAKGLELLEAGALEWHPATERRHAQVGFGPMMPEDVDAIRDVAMTVKAAGPWLQRLAKFVQAAVAAVLGRERKKLAKDAADIAAVCKEMGLTEDPRLKRIRANYGKGEEPGFGS